MAITYDQSLIEEIAARFDLRDPNKRALSDVVRAIADARGDFREMVADLATGVGKTFLMSSLVEYLAQQGVRHVLVVTPGSTIQRKTIANFDAASTKYVAGADIAPYVVTPGNFQAASVGTVLRDPRRLKVFVFNVQLLIRPSDKVSRRVREDDENLGDALYDQLEAAGDLFIIADEHHLYRDKAVSFSAAIRDLHPVALVGLTATPDKDDYAKIISQYTLGEAIADGHVKTPVIVYRKDGTKDERTQLRDACQLLRHKEQSYAQYCAATEDVAEVKPVLFVVCQSIEHASEVGQILAGGDYIGDPNAVLEITSDSSEEALEALLAVEQADSAIRAIVSVNMLREGWDVKNIAVIAALRKLASQTLTEQILGRGLRLPFGRRTDIPDVDQVDLVSHDSYKQLLEQKDVLRQRIQLPSNAVPVDDHGAATTPTLDLSQPRWGQQEAEDERPSSTPGVTPTNPGQHSLFDGLGDEFDGLKTPVDDEVANPALVFRETDTRIQAPSTEYLGRVANAPQILFPRRESRLDYAPFDLADVASGDAQAAGVRFINEVPTFIFRDALEAHRQGDDVTITRRRLEQEEAQQTLAGLDVVHADLVTAVLQQEEVPKVRASRNGAERLVKAFLKGAGVTSETASAEWGQNRRLQAVEGMRELIRDAIRNRRRQRHFEFKAVELPIEPVPVPGDARDASNDAFLKKAPFVGWRKNILPVASFDAKTTEWELAHLLDGDPAITWWLRIYVDGPAFITTERDAKYFPDFVAIDTGGVFWLIEGKGDHTALDADVVRKKEAAEKWARAVVDDGEHGTWRYMFATESNIKNAGGSWNALVLNTRPE